VLEFAVSNPCGMTPCGPRALIMALNCSKGNLLSAGDVPVVFQLMNRSKDG